MLWAKKYKLLSLKNYEDQFLYYINKFSKELTRHDDIKWFDTNTNWCLQKTYKNYLDWTFVVTDDYEEELIAFAAVQDFGNDVARILTRLYYNPKYNVLRVIVKYKESPFYSHYPIIELKNIPLQRWNNYIVVLHNNDVKIYLNKKLIVHKSLPNIPEVTSSNIIVGEQNNNIIGEISQLRVYFRPYNSKDIKKIM